MTSLNIENLSETELAELYQWPQTRTLRLNLVLDSSGSVVGPDGTSNTLTNPQDRKLLRAIRSQSDVVIQGAQTIRQEGWFLPPRGRLFVLSSSHDLPWETCLQPEKVHVFSNVASMIHNLAPGELRLLCEGGLTSAELLTQRYGFDEIALSFINTVDVLNVPSSLTDGSKYDLVTQMHSPTHTMSFGLWRRAT